MIIEQQHPSFQYLQLRYKIIDEIRRGTDYLDSFHGLQPLHSSSLSKNIDYFVGKASLLYPDPMVANYKSPTLSNSVDILLVQSI